MTDDDDDDDDDNDDKYRCVSWIPTAKALQLRIPVYKSTIYQGCTNPGRQVAVATEFCTVSLIFVDS